VSGSFLGGACRVDRKSDSVPRDEYSGLRRAYAAATGVTVRTAQRHQRQNHPDWMRFVGVQASEGVRRREREGAMEPAEATALATVSPARPEERPSFYVEEEEGLSPAQVNEKRAWEIHERTYRTWQDMLCDPRVESVVALAFARELPKLREDYEKARMARERWELETRRLIPLHEFEAFVGTFLVPLAELLRNLPVELPVVANPENPALARSRILEWLRAKAEPQIEGLLAGAGSLKVA
jgi:hypothetical protein